MKNFIETICLVCVIICAIGFVFSLAINDIAMFIFSTLFMFAFFAIALLDIARK